MARPAGGALAALDSNADPDRRANAQQARLRLSLGASPAEAEFRADMTSSNYEPSAPDRRRVRVSDISKVPGA